MSKVERIGLEWTTVYSRSETATFAPGSRWYRASDVAKVRVPFEMRDSDTDIEVSAAYQLANVENSPDSPALAIGSYATSDGNIYPTSFADINSATEAKQLIRFGWLCRNTNGSGTTLSLARVTGVVEIIECQ